MAKMMSKSGVERSRNANCDNMYVFPSILAFVMLTSFHHGTISVKKVTRLPKMTFYLLNYLASTYGTSSYNVATYGTSSGASSGSSTGPSASPLTNTGVAIAGIVTLAALILLAAMAVRIWKRPAKQATVPVESDDDVSR